jgi:hypothetical protein
MLFDKFIYDTQEPKTQSVLWIRPQLGKEVTIEAFIDGKWKTIGGGDPSKYLTKEAFEAFKATYNQTIDGLEHRITDLETVINRSSYVITLQKDPSITGTVSGGGRFITGTSVTVVATPDAQSDYPEFDGWYESGTKVSENASYTFTVSGARTLVAKFVAATSKTLVASVWANQECTERPVVGQTYTTLYVKLHKAFGFGDINTWGDATDVFSNLTVFTPTNEEPEEKYAVGLWTDWFSADTTEPFTSGQIIAVTTEVNDPVRSSAVFDFYLEDADTQESEES